MYGKCSNPHGHGHNYVLEVTMTRPGGSTATGMIANLGELDPFVEREVLEAFDQKYLNEEVPEFAAIVPTTENVARAIFRRLKAFRRRGSPAYESKRPARIVSNMTARKINSLASKELNPMKLLERRLNY